MNQDEIDIKRIIQNRLGSKARWIPGFVYSGLRKLIHEDFLNEFIRRFELAVYLDADAVIEHQLVSHAKHANLHSSHLPIVQYAENGWSGICLLADRVRSEAIAFP
jgi:hypothetical protein